jgi:hypothetical protein
MDSLPIIPWEVAVNKWPTKATFFVRVADRFGHTTTMCDVINCDEDIAPGVPNPGQSLQIIDLLFRMRCLSPDTYDPLLDAIIVHTCQGVDAARVSPTDTVAGVINKWCDICSELPPLEGHLYIRIVVVMHDVGQIGAIMSLDCLHAHHARVRALHFGMDRVEQRGATKKISCESLDGSQLGKEPTPKMRVTDPFDRRVPSPAGFQRPRYRSGDLPFLQPMRHHSPVRFQTDYPQRLAYSWLNDDGQFTDAEADVRLACAQSIMWAKLSLQIEDEMFVLHGHKKTSEPAAGGGAVATTDCATSEAPSLDVRMEHLQSIWSSRYRCPMPKVLEELLRRDIPHGPSSNWTIEDFLRTMPSCGMLPRFDLMPRYSDAAIAENWVLREQYHPDRYGQSTERLQFIPLTLSGAGRPPQCGTAAHPIIVAVLGTPVDDDHLRAATACADLERASRCAYYDRFLECATDVALTHRTQALEALRVCSPPPLPDTRVSQPVFRFSGASALASSRAAVSSPTDRVTLDACFGVRSLDQRPDPDVPTPAFSDADDDDSAPLIAAQHATSSPSLPLVEYPAIEEAPVLPVPPRPRSVLYAQMNANWLETINRNQDGTRK